MSVLLVPSVIQESLPSLVGEARRMGAHAYHVDWADNAA